MASAAKAKGTRWESDLVKHLESYGIDARRVAQSGRLDVGDIHGIDPFVGQAKSYRDIVAGLREGLEGARVQAARVSPDAIPVAFVKRPGKGTGAGYAVLDVDTFARLLLRLRAQE